MARRRPTPAKSLKKKNNPTRDRIEASRFRAESLEPRRLFVVLHGGDVFEFWAENTHFERVVVSGNTTVELFGTDPLIQAGLAPGQAPAIDSMHGVIVSGPDSFSNAPGTDIEAGSQIGGGLPPEAAPNGGGGGGSGGSTPHSDSLWAIYVSQSDANSSIAIAATNPLNAATRPMLPFVGSETLHVRPTAGTADIDVSVANSGDVYIGARALPPQGAASQGFPTNQPILFPATLPLDQQTVSPGITALGPGVTITPGNNMGQMMIGGTLSGTVNIHGAVDLFYAGWLVTGNADGEAGAGLISVPQNFNVDGDIHNLLTNGAIGTNTDSGLTNLASPTYVTGFSMHVGGKAGMIKSEDSFVGALDVTNSPTAPSLDGIPYSELDVRSLNDPWDAAIFGGDGAVNDQTFTGAQFLGTIDNAGTVQVNGSIEGLSATNNKSVDYYAIPLIAGQTVTAQIATGFTAFVNGAETTGVSLGVFDPLDRLLATDYNGANLSETSGQPFEFTANVPGIYYFAVAEPLNNSFAASGGPVAGILPYTLTVTNVGTLGLSGLSATNNVLDAGANLDPFSANSAGVHVVNGDLGAVFAGNLIMSDNASSYFVDNGNLRAVTATSIGNGIGAAGQPGTGNTLTSGAFVFGSGPNAGVPNGTVGMLRATGTLNGAGQGGTSVLVWNFAALALGTNGGLTGGLNTPIGGDYQMIDAANQFIGDVVAEGNIGTIRAAGMASFPASFFQVNAFDDPTRHGTIDLIDVTGDMGTVGAGGPAIRTGPDGNVRYIHVGGTAFRDVFFGGGTPETTLFQPGETALITDDSGANVSITPQNPADSLIIETYPIESSGGSAIVSIQVTNTTGATTAGGVNVTTSGQGSAEIGAIILDGTGTGVTAGTVAAGATTTTAPGATTSGFPPAGSPGGAPVAGAASSGNKFTLPNLPSPPTLATTGAPLDVSISGSVKTDVYSITNGAGVADVTSLTNSTPGEIVNLQLGSLGTAAINGALGVALEHNTANEVIGNQIKGTGMAFSYPLFDISSLARIVGNAGSISAGVLGNVLVGTIAGEAAPAINTSAPVVPGGVLSPAGTNGQIGSLHAGAIVGSVVAAGTINSTSAGSIGWQGSGALGAPGIFSTSLIGPVSVNGDVRGQIISTVGQVGLTISNGSLNNAVVADYSRFDFAEARALGVVSPSSATPFTLPQLDLASVVVKGSGGIIGSRISGEHIGTVSVAPTGYGILSSTFSVLGDGTIVGVAAGGYGIRFSIFSGGASFGAITALGDGSELPVTSFPASVRTSETGTAFDPATGLAIGFLNDLDAYLGTSVSAPRIVGVTESGVIENTDVRSSRDLGSLNAWSIRGRTVASTNPFVLVQTITNVDVANTVGQINVKAAVNGFELTTGRTSKYNFGGSVANFHLTVAGLIGALVFKSSLLGSSSITAGGPGGRIGSIVVHGNFSGFIKATNTITSLQIFGSLSGLVQAKSLGTLTLTGGLGQGSLQITGNIGTIQTTGDLGIPGNTLTVFGALKVLKIGRNLNTAVTIGKSLGQFIVGGSILDSGNVSVGTTITSLRVDGDVDAGAIVKAHIIKKRLIRGQLLGTITTA